MSIIKHSFICAFLIATTAGRPDNTNGLKEAEGGYLFQGDMIMSKAALDAIENGEDVDTVLTTPTSAPDGPRVAFSAVGMYALKWENGVVPYVLHKDAECKWYKPCWTSIGRPEKSIRSAMKEWEEKTKSKSGKSCIRFVPRNNERDYVEFTNKGFGQCYSHVGRITGKQVISLSTGCSSHGIALHEIGHALGLHHEQSRPDRDDYVTVHYDNIEEGREINFKKYSFSRVNGLGSPYDYGSIMHYPEDAFSKSWFKDTIEPKRDVDIGQRDHLSPTDVKTIKKFYGCSD